jgi:PAS domain S-box-containing protein
MRPDHVAHSGHPAIVRVRRWRDAEMTLTAKLAVAMILLVAIAVSAVGWLSYRSLEQAVLPRVLDRIEAHSRLVASDLESSVAGARGDIAGFRSSAGLNGLIRSHLAGGIDPIDGVSEDTWHQRFAERLAAELKAKPAYAELRIIGLDDGQREIVRVDRSGPNGAVRIVPAAELQRKGERTYFKETIQLKPDGIYVSPLNLAKRGGVIKTPYAPSLRIATPIFAPDGKPFGIIIINVDMRPAFDRVRSSVPEGRGIYVVDKQGDYLVHPDRPREFGSELGKPANWQSDFPDLASALGATLVVAQIRPDHTGLPSGIALAPAFLAGSEWVGVIEAVPNAAFMAPAAAIKKTSLLVGLIAVLCAGALAVLVARSLTRPIRQLTAAVEGIGGNDPVAIPVDADGETGVLARAFARVMGEANAKAAALEREVREHRRTVATRDHHAARERLFSAAVESSNDAVVTLSLDGMITGWNPAAERLFGYGATEAMGRGIDLIFPTARLVEMHDLLRLVGEGETIEHHETVQLRRDGGPVEVSLAMSPIKTPSGAIIGIFKTARDITESKRTQQALGQEIEERRRIFETSQDLILITDAKGVLIQVSPSSEATLGYLPEEMIGHSAVDFIHGDDLDNTRDEMRAARRGMHPRNFDSRYVHKDGRIVMLSWMGTWSEPVRRHFFVGRDMTDRIAAEERIRHAEKMEAVGQLTGGIAHDFNNILTVITGTIEILAEAVQTQPQLAAITRMIDEAASRGADLTAHLLAFARKQPLRPRETDVNVLIIDTAQLLRPTLGEQIEIESVFKDESCFATVDANQLATAMINLALNARDAMPDGGKLIFETGSAYLDEDYAGLHDVQPGRYALIAVSDTGSGIPADILDKVFEPFFTSKGPGKGTGLGLSMVYGFVKQSAGHIQIYSEEGHGTTIKIYLPPGTGFLSDSDAAFAPTIQGGDETILVVEDDRLVRDYVLTQLHSLGYVTLQAANGTEALAIVEAGHEFDLLFTDVIMPGAMNGRQLADEVARRRPGSKVLFTSGYTENAIIHHGRLDSGVMLLAKPYRKSDMAGMIRAALDG